MDKKLHIDIETYSSIDIRKAGAYRYCRSLDFEILMVAYAFGDEEIKIVDLAQGEKLPKRFIDALLDPSYTKLAHNAVFERQCFEQAGYSTPPEVWECTAIKSAYCGLPLALGQVSGALKLEELGKLTRGKALIKYFCVPCKPTRTNGQRYRNFPHHDLEKWEEFKTYCINDVAAEREICRRLAKYKIPQFEKDNYYLDQKINDRGVLIDLEMAKNATRINTIYTNELLTQAKTLTGLDNPNSPTQLKRWLSERLGKEITTLAKNELANLIQEVGEGAISDVLRLRQKLSKSSVKKYLAMLACACYDGRARGLFQFYGASRTGRWAGRLIQLQNLPKNKMKDLAQARGLVTAGNYDDVAMTYGDISGILSQLIRTALVAKKGHTFAVADFSAIEARVIAWFAGEQWRLDVFNSHGMIYEASASMMFGLPIEKCMKVEKGGLEGIRAKGKVAELALGYQGAVGALKTIGGERMGLSEFEMKAIVARWRKANPKVVKLWKTVNENAKRALRTRKKVVSEDGKLAFHYNGQVLRIRLPSGRCLFYFEPRFGTNKFGSETIKYRGMSQTTRQWTFIDTYGGKLVENIVQATARDLLAFSMRNLDKEGFEIAMHVHDEAICEIPTENQEHTLEKMCTIMGVAPTWAEGLPLDADGYLTPFYKKD